MMKQKILDLVINRQGIKAVELALAVMEDCNPIHFEIDEFHLALNELIEQGEIIEITYTLPQLKYRVKSFYLPKGTSFELSIGTI